MSPRAQLVASIVQTADSVYWSTLRDIYRGVQEGKSWTCRTQRHLQSQTHLSCVLSALQEAEDVTMNLHPVQVKLEEVQQVEFQQVVFNLETWRCVLVLDRCDYLCD